MCPGGTHGGHAPSPADSAATDDIGAELFDIDLRQAILHDADLSGAFHDQADLRGTDLRDVIGLNSQQIKQAKLDEHTQLPPTVDNPLHGPA